MLNRNTSTSSLTISVIQTQFISQGFKCHYLYIKLKEMKRGTENVFFILNCSIIHSVLSVVAAIPRCVDS